MNAKNIGLVLAVIVTIVVLFYYFTDSNEVVVQEVQVTKSETPEIKVPMKTEAIILEDKSVALVESKEKIVEEVVEEPKKELAIPNGFEEVSAQELQKITQSMFDTENYTQLYDQDSLNIFIDKELQKSMKKSKVQNLSLLIIKYIERGSVLIRKDENKKLYLEVLEYNNSEQRDLGNKFAKSEHVYHFGFDKSSINEDENIELFLHDLDVAIKEADAKNLILVGYTDSVGSKEYNTFLSYKRAQALSKRLEKQNIAVKYVLRGEANPVASNETPEGRAQNRRIEMFLGL